MSLCSSHLFVRSFVQCILMLISILDVRLEIFYLFLFFYQIVNNVVVLLLLLLLNVCIYVSVLFYGVFSYLSRAPRPFSHAFLNKHVIISIFILIQ